MKKNVAVLLSIILIAGLVFALVSMERFNQSLDELNNEAGETLGQINGLEENVDKLSGLKSAVGELAEQVRGLEKDLLIKQHNEEVSALKAEIDRLSAMNQALQSGGEGVSGSLDCGNGQIIPTEGYRNAKVAPCGGLWFSPYGLSLKGNYTWTDISVDGRSGVRHENLRVRRDGPRHRFRMKLIPGTYELPDGVVVVHERKK